MVRGRSQPAPAAGDVFGRRVALDADTGIEPPFTEAAHDLGGLPGVGEPEGLRRAEGGLVRPQDAGGDHNGAPLRQERTGAGVRGRRPRPPGATAAAVPAALLAVTTTNVSPGPTAWKLTTPEWSASASTTVSSSERASGRNPGGLK